jgi:hypothetical protein
VKTKVNLSVLAALSVVTTLPGCGGEDRPATWAYISPVILQPNCATGSCHSPAAAVDGLDFSTPDRGYASLTKLWVWYVNPAREGQPGCGHADGKVICEEQFRPLVTPYDPWQSRLVNVLRGRDAPRMPPDRPLDEADIRLIEQWILAGARQNETPIVLPDAGPPLDGGADSADGAVDGGAEDGPSETAPRGDAPALDAGDAHEASSG